MKKIYLIISIFFIITGCSNKEEKEIIHKQEDTNIKEEIIENKYIDDNPIKVGLYKNNNIIKSYTTNLANYQDITSFDIYYTNEEKLEKLKQKDNYLKYYNKYQNIEKYKTGFYISFEAEGNKIEELILGPASQHSMSPYLYVYLYDDINQEPGTYYSHLTQEEVKDNTIISSIKLFLAQQGTLITSPITLTVFTYDNEDDFDENNHYRGNSSYTIEIKTNN